MKPIKATINDTDALIELGRASVQIVHDLKNQINGLKLYATFLRKRMERSERPADELETINKIMAGLERAASDMNMLVRLGRPLELQRTPRRDLAALLAAATEGDYAAPHHAPAEDGKHFQGNFDAPALTEALKNIHAGARSLAARDTVPSINLRREESPATGADAAGADAAGAEATPNAIIEWQGIKAAAADNDVFSSFNGGTGLRLALAARIIQAHDGTVEQGADTLRVRLPLGSAGNSDE